MWIYSGFSNSLYQIPQHKKQTKITENPTICILILPYHPLSISKAAANYPAKPIEALTKIHRIIRNIEEFGSIILMNFV